MNRYEAVFKRQDGLIKALLKQAEADQKVIDAQGRQIQALAEKADILERQALALGEAGSRMAAENKELGEICLRQQELLERLSRASQDAGGGGGLQGEKA